MTLHFFPQAAGLLLEHQFPKGIAGLKVMFAWLVVFALHLWPQ